MKKLIVVSGILMSSAAYAQEAPPVIVDGPSNNPNQRVCMTVAETGSRLSRTRICRTRAQWEQDRRETRQNVERSQANRNPRQF